MSSLVHDDSTSEVEVTNISAHGVWLLAHGKELFISYEESPWFRDVSVKLILNVEEVSPVHFYWPDLDVDLTEEIIANPESFPLKADIKKGSDPLLSELSN
jgi:hypothetical protein